MTILSGLLIFTIIVVVHELGHYWAARAAGIHVEEFSVGMGPRLLHFTKNGTIWSLKLFPLGGSCRMLGMLDEEEGAETADDTRSFNSKHVGWRILVIAGGAIMNFVLALLIATALSLFTASADTTIGGFSVVSPAAEAGIQIGDRIVRVNNRNVNVHGDFMLEMHRADGSPIDIVVERDGQRLNFTLTPHYLEDEERFIAGFIPGRVVGPFHGRTWTDADGNTGYVDDLPGVRRESFIGGLTGGFHDMTFYVRFTMFAVSSLFTDGLGGLMGPVGIVTAVGGQVEQSFEAGGGMAAFWALMSFTLLLSVNLGILNLLPLPALDGGRLVFLFIEAIRRKPLNPKIVETVHFVGIVLLMVLMVVVLYNDIMRLITG